MLLRLTTWDVLPSFVPETASKRSRSSLIIRYAQSQSRKAVACESRNRFSNKRRSFAATRAQKPARIERGASSLAKWGMLYAFLRVSSMLSSSRRREAGDGSLHVLYITVMRPFFRLAMAICFTSSETSIGQRHYTKVSSKQERLTRRNRRGCTIDR